MRVQTIKDTVSVANKRNIRIVQNKLKENLYYKATDSLSKNNVGSIVLLDSVNTSQYLQCREIGAKSGFMGIVQNRIRYQKLQIVEIVSATRCEIDFA